MEYGLVKL